MTIVTLQIVNDRLDLGSSTEEQATMGINLAFAKVGDRVQCIRTGHKGTLVPVDTAPRDDVVRVRWDDGHEGFATIYSLDRLDE